MESPIFDGIPVTTLNISGGSPASYRTSASSKAVNGVSSVGLQTIRLLVAIDGAILCATMFSGWLNGVMALITPSSGSRWVKIYTALAMRRQVAGENLAVIDDAELTGKMEYVEGTADFVQAVFLGNAAFRGDDVGNFFLALDQNLSGLHQDLLTLVAGQVGLVGSGLLERIGDLAGISVRHGADDRTIIRVQNLDTIGAVDVFAGNPHGFVAGDKSLI